MASKLKSAIALADSRRAKVNGVAFFCERPVCKSPDHRVAFFANLLDHIGAADIYLTG
jgi:hypothetical protein